MVTPEPRSARRAELQAPLPTDHPDVRIGDYELCARFDPPCSSKPHRVRDRLVDVEVTTFMVAS